MGQRRLDCSISNDGPARRSRASRATHTFATMVRRVRRQPLSRNRIRPVRPGRRRATTPNRSAGRSLWCHDRGCGRHYRVPPPDSRQLVALYGSQAGQLLRLDLNALGVDSGSRHRRSSRWLADSGANADLESVGWRFIVGNVNRHQDQTERRIRLSVVVQPCAARRRMFAVEDLMTMESSALIRSAMARRWRGTAS